MVRSYTGDIALCNLSSVNLMKWVKLTPIEKEEFMYLLVKSMDNAIDNSFYANPLGNKHSKEHRNLGIGESNYANVLATNRLSWSSKGARKLTHNMQEEISYYGIKASIRLASERGAFSLYKKSKWSEGIFPHELSILGKTDSELNYPLLMDWEILRQDLLKFGIRNEYIYAVAPTACQTKDAMIQTHEGSKSLETLMNEQGISHVELEKKGIPKWLEFKTPISIPTRKGAKEISKIYYNGKQPTRTITFEDDTKYTFTYNHKLLLTTGEWKYVGELTEKDEIIAI
jgi:hypothetical protein